MECEANENSMLPWARVVERDGNTLVISVTREDGKPIRLWKAIDTVLAGEVMQCTSVQPSERTREKKRSYRLRAMPAPRASGDTPTK